MTIAITAQSNVIQSNALTSVNGGIGLTPIGGSGNIVIALLMWGANPGSPTTPKWNSSAQTFNVLVAPTLDSTSGFYYGVYWLVNANAVNGNFTCTWTNSVALGLLCVEWSGLNLTTPIGNVHVTSGTTQTSYSGTVTTTAADAAMDVILGANAHGIAATTGTGQTQIGSLQNSGTYDFAASYINPVSGTTATFGWSIFGAGTFWCDVALDLAAPSAVVSFQLGTDVQSSGLAALALANEITICSAVPTSYANAGTVELGSIEFGIGNCFTAPVDNAGPPANMQVSSTAITSGSVTANGTPTCWAVLDDVNSRLLAWGPLTGAAAVTIGQSWTLGSFTINVPVQ